MRLPSSTGVGKEWPTPVQMKWETERLKRPLVRSVMDLKGSDGRGAGIVDACKEKERSGLV